MHTVLRSCVGPDRDPRSPQPRSRTRVLV